MAIIRNGQRIGPSEEDSNKKKMERKNRMALRQELKVKISDLVPYETAVIKDVVEEYKEDLKKNKELKKPRVHKINGKFIVVDGNNRVKAMEEQGYTEIDVIVTPHDSDREDDFKRTIKKREQDKVDFSNIRKVDSDDARKKLSEEEIKLDFEDQFFEELMKHTTSDNEDNEGEIEITF